MSRKISERICQPAMEILWRITCAKSLQQKNLLMKKQFLLLLMLMYVVVIYSQSPGGGAASLLDVPVLTGRTTPELLTHPNIEQICFDKKMKLLSTTGGRTLETCLFINTKKGIIGYFSGATASTGSCNINSNTDGFRFAVISLRGNSFQYITSEKNGRLVKTVMTYNSDFFPSSGGSRPAGGGGTMRKLNERGSYAGGAVTTYAYQAPGSPAKFHLFGSSYPAQITVTSSAKSLGAFGVGYMLFQNKIYLVMEMIGGSDFTTAITEVENTHTCFNTDGYEIFEDEFTREGMSQILENEQRVMRELPSSTCPSEQLKLKNFKLEALARQKAYLEKTRQGNSMENRQTQEAYAKVMNYDDIIQQMIYEQELKICKLEADQSVRSRALDAASYSRKRMCYSRQLQQMHRVKAEMQEIDRRHPDSPGLQNADKARLIFQIDFCD